MSSTQSFTPNSPPDSPKDTTKAQEPAADKIQPEPSKPETIGNNAEASSSGTTLDTPASSSTPISTPATSTPTKPTPSKPAASRKPRCHFKSCNALAQRVVGDCGFCGNKFCGKHRLLESHACSGLEDCKDEARERNRERLETERTVVVRGV